jgi:hypothetical protein
VSFEFFMMSATKIAPTLAEWVTRELEPGVRACFEALNQLQGAREAVLTANLPVLLWNGRDDLYHDPMQAFAAANGLRFLSTAGDHLGMLFLHGFESANGIRLFLDRTLSRLPA